MATGRPACPAWTPTLRPNWPLWWRLGSRKQITVCPLCLFTKAKQGTTRNRLILEMVLMSELTIQSPRWTGCLPNQRSGRASLPTVLSGSVTCYEGSWLNSRSGGGVRGQQLPKVPESWLWVDSAVTRTLISLPQQTPAQSGAGTACRAHSWQAEEAGRWAPEAALHPHAPSSPEASTTLLEGGLKDFPRAVLPPVFIREKCQTYKQLKEFSSEFPHT